jgi:hypothetical protein
VPSAPKDGRGARVRLNAMFGRDGTHGTALLLRIRKRRGRKLLCDPESTHDKFVNFQPSDSRPAYGKTPNSHSTDS